jgi:hypothetical protein
MGDRWFEDLRPICKQACVEAGAAQATDVALFYLARWCQKKAKRDEPDLGVFERTALCDLAERIVANLAEDGERVELLVAGDAAELSRLKRLLLASARPRAKEAAPDYADEALQRISIVLLTGTPPRRAAEELEKGPEGPSNEYVFHAPFDFWAGRVVINLIIDERRRAAREREGPAPPPRQTSRPLDKAMLKEAHNALPGLLDAIGRLPKAQRSAMVVTLSRPEVDELVRERFHKLAPDLFSAAGGVLFSSDAEMAEHLGSTPRRVAANRSLARRKLAERDARWELLLDQLLPHASTRPIRSKQAVAARGGNTTENSDD